MRRRVPRRIGFSAQVNYFKPRGVPMHQLSEVVLMADEVEAIRLYEVEEMDQINAAEKMGVSQPTFARILDRANKKIAEALIKGKAIRLESQAS